LRFADLHKIAFRDDDTPARMSRHENTLRFSCSAKDAALAQTVQAHRKALQQLVDQGASLRETQLKKAVGDIEKMEDNLLAAVRKAAAGAGPTVEGPWAGVLKTMQGQGTGTGALAGATVEQLMDGAQKSLKEGRALGRKASQAMLDSYTALVSGVLIGLSDALQPAGDAVVQSERTTR
jgi:hypothetical protein